MTVEEPIESIAARYVQTMADPSRSRVFIDCQVLMAQMINRVGTQEADRLIEEARKTWQLMVPPETKTHPRFR